MTAPAKRQTKKTAEPGPFWHFQGASVVELAARLEAAGPHAARLEIRIDARNNMTLRVVSTDPPPTTVATNDLSDINDSRVCPPICP